MGIVAWLVLGLIAGFIASMLVNKQGEGMLMDIVLGIVGAVVGGFIAQAIGFSGITGLNLYSILIAVGGARGGACRLPRDCQAEFELSTFRLTLFSKEKVSWDFYRRSRIPSAAITSSGFRPGRGISRIRIRPIKNRCSK